MEKLYTILNVNFNRHILSFFQMQLVEQYSVKQLSSKNLSYIFSIFTEFSVGFLRDKW